MISVDKIAIIWSVVIVAIAVGFATVSNMSSDTKQGDSTTAFVYPNTGAKQTTETVATSIFLQTDRNTYSNNDQIQVSGSVGKKVSDLPIALIVIDPNGDVAVISQINVGEDRAFSDTIPIGGPLWKQEGKYTIKAHYGEKNTTTTFDLFLPTVSSELSDVFSVQVGEKVFSVNYNITNSKIQNAALSPDCLCLVVMIETHDRGMITLELPRKMIDARLSNGNDDIFFVLMDGIEIPYDEISANPQSRTIQVRFDNGTSELEIIGTNLTP